MKHPLFFTLATALVLSACGGSVTPSGASTVQAGNVVLKNSSNTPIATLAFSSTGASNAQSFFATQLSASAALHESDTCGSSGKAIASVQTQSSSAASSTFMVTPLNAGACAITVSGANGDYATLSVTVTVTSVPIQ